MGYFLHVVQMSLRHKIKAKQTHYDFNREEENQEKTPGLGQRHIHSKGISGEFKTKQLCYNTWNQEIMTLTLTTVHDGLVCKCV